MVEVPELATQVPGQGELEAVAVIVATAVLLLLQVTCVVRSLVEASEYVPVAVNCTDEPLNCDGFVGVTAILDSVGVGLWQVTVVLLLTAPSVAVSVTVPADKHLTVCVTVVAVWFTTMVCGCMWNEPPASSCWTTKL